MGKFTHLGVFRVKISIKKYSSVKMVCKVAVGEAAASRVLLEGFSMGGCWDKISGTTAAIQGHQIICIGMPKRIQNLLVCLLFSKGKV